MPFVSTIPAAITTVQGYMNTVAAATAVSDVGVYVNYAQTQNLTYNYMMIGEYESGLMIAPTEGQWASMGVTAKRREEKYAILGHVRTWAGGNDWQSRWNDAMTLLDSLYDQILADPGGSNNLTPSGSWGGFNWTVHESGPLGNASGFGFIIGFQLQVINAQIHAL